MPPRRSTHLKGGESAEGCDGPGGYAFTGLFDDERAGFRIKMLQDLLCPRGGVWGLTKACSSLTSIRARARDLEHELKVYCQGFACGTRHYKVMGQ